MKKFLLLIMSVMAVASVSAFRKTQSPVKDAESPDFAFPQTVTTDASVEMKKAMKESRYVDALRSAMQIVIANGLVDRGNTQASIAMLDSLGAQMPSDYSAVATMLQAQVYADYFRSNRYAFSGRTLPLSSYPENIVDWSRGLFAKKIAELVQKANAALVGDGVALTSLAPILTSTEAAVLVPSERDFLVYKGIDLLQAFSSASMGVIPFRAAGTQAVAEGSPYSDAAGLMRSLVDAEIESCRGRGLSAPLAYAMTRKARMLDGKEREEWLSGCLEELKDNPASIMIINQMAVYSSPGSFFQGDKEIPEKTAEARRFYGIAKSALDRWPDSYGSARLSNTIQALIAPQMRVKSEKQFASSAPVKMEVSVANASDVYVLLFKMPTTAEYSNKTINTLVQGLKPVKGIRLGTGISVPGRMDTVVDFGTQPYGLYLAVPSMTDGVAGIPDVVGKERASLFSVSDMRVITAGVSGKEQRGNVYVVDAVTGCPIEGAKVDFRSYEKGSLRTHSSAVTDRNGCVDSPRGSWNLRIKKGSDLLMTRVYLYTSGESRSPGVTAAEILTDLAIYHPGDSVGFVAVAYSVENRNYSALSGTELALDLRDASGNIVATKNLVTDKHGRVAGSFVLPQTGLLGNWSISAESGGDNVGWGNFQVSDYKSPTFYVEIDSVSPAAKAGDEVIIKGNARTYSGMPVAGAQVKYDIRYVSRWCWHGTESPDATFAGETATDGEGRFEIRLDTRMLADTPYSFGAYRLNVAVTSPSGETQTSAPASFALGSAYSIQSVVPSVVDGSTGKAVFTVQVKDMLGLPAAKRVDYLITDAAGKTVEQGDFMPMALTIDLHRLSSGRYNIEFMVAGEDTTSSSKVKDTFILYRPDESVPPVETRLWVPVRSITAPKGAKDVEITVGSCYPDSHILCYAVSNDGISESQWLNVDRRNRKVKVAVPGEGERKWLTLATVADMKSHTAIVEILPASADDKLEIRTESFRDRLTPGDREEWKFKFTYAGKPQPFMPTIAVLSDKALNAITPFVWNFSPNNSNGFYNPLSIEANNAGNLFHSYLLRKLADKKESGMDMPDWQTYGYSFVPYGYGGRLRIRGTHSVNGSADGVYYAVNEMKMASAPMADMKSAKEDDVVEEAAVETAGSADGGVVAESVQMREIEHPLGFFMPMLETDGEGVQTLSFVVPDYNTTWQLQLLGYTPQMKTAKTTLEATASKPVMVRSNPPRFLRTGDIASIAAVYYNATDSLMPVWGEIEVIDPMTGNVLASAKTPSEQLAASGNRKMAVEFKVPDSVQCLLLRAYARSEMHSDGEQTLIQVLPSSTPVIESTAFYLAPGDVSFGVKLPAYGMDATLTLQYCDNPVWYCVTALPSITMPKSKNLLSLLKAYYGSAMAKGLTEKYHRVKSGLESILASAPQSNLSINGELKNVELINTPWVNNAASETARMRSLSSLLMYSGPTIDRLRGEILALQNADGGWSWCPRMESSSFMTRNVLLHFGMLRQNGYLGDDKALADALKKGRRYLDSSILEYYNRNKRRITSGEALDWLYVRGFYPKSAESASIASLHGKGLDMIRKDWRGFDIFQKARASVVLNREGLSTQAKTILESLRQYAVVSPELGMRYQNLDAGWSGHSALLTTAQVLEAFALVEPDSPCVDQLRQGLILQRETEDWGVDSYTVDVVQAILASGSEWTAESPVPQISLRGKPVMIPVDPTPVGYYKINIPAEEASGAELLINKRSQGPAWGSVMSQYVAPITGVKQVSMPEISIAKAVYAVTDRPGATVEEVSDLKVGQKVRVTLTINTTRDMDYVAITDSRSACLEPAEQTSGYDSSDGIWFYREVRDEATNIFIGFLPKGSHVISYDCYVDREGDYSLGIATAQSQYAPQMVAHSAGKMMKVK